MMLQIKLAFRTVKENFRILISTFITITVLLTMLGLLGLTYRNLTGVFEKLFEINHFTVIFKNATLPEDKFALLEQLKKLDGIQNVKTLAQREVKEQLKHSLKNFEGDINSISTDFFPEVIEFVMSDLNEKQLNKIKRIASEPYVEELFNSLNYNTSIQAFFKAVDLIGMVFIAFMFISLYFIIENSIQLMIYSRLKEIEIYMLFGAKRTFIFYPLLIQMICMSILSLMIAFLVNSILFELVLKGLEKISPEISFDQFTDFYSFGEFFQSMAAIIVFSLLYAWFAFNKIMNRTNF